MPKFKTQFQKSLFSRYYATCSGIIAATIVLMGIMTVGLSASYFSRQNREKLETGVEKAAEITLDSMAAYNYSKLSSNMLEVGYGALSSVNGCTIFLTDAQGHTLACSEGADCCHMTYTIPSDIMDKALTGEYSETGKLSGIYDSSYYTVGIPVTNGEKVFGAVFASAPATDFFFYVSDLIEIIVLCALVAIVVSSTAIYFITRKMTEPLRSMAKATKSFAAGDFSVRVPVEGKDEIAQLAASFNQMADSLADMDAVRNNFVANVSHELKTPMMTIGGFVDGILDGTVPPEKQHQYLETISDEVKRLSRMVKSMLAVSKIEAGEMKLNPSVFDINSLIIKTVFTFEQKINDKGIDIVGLDSDEVYVNADSDLIHQVIYNLIDNAIKFSNEGGYISFSYAVNEGRVFISIRNTGAGISQEELPRIFDRFYKSDKSRALDRTGVGLGLYIVQSIVRQHDGDLIAKSVEGEYTEFTFSVESARAPEKPYQSANVAST